MKIWSDGVATLPKQRRKSKDQQRVVGVSLSMFLFDKKLSKADGGFPKCGAKILLFLQMAEVYSRKNEPNLHFLRNCEEKD
ncbi:MAG: hypothetical protein D8B56_03140 [Alloprevotella sp.]|nr:MAG: hypothetical protein D8B56_03140 [Alloprevotella sp.]